MLERIEIFCFAASYGVALILEASRLFFRAPIRVAVIVAFTVAGLTAHALYLYARAQRGLEQAGAPLSTWSEWCLLAAWGLAALYLLLAFRRPRTTVGLFVLPLVFLLIGVAWLQRDAAPFPRSQAIGIWGAAHGGALLLGTVAVLFGFAAGLMYLVQVWRLKHKTPPQQGIQLPSLEWLQMANERALLVSTLFLAVGLLAGLVLNLFKHVQQQTAMPWSDPVVWTSAVLFLWLVAASIFTWLYRPARQGQKVAYLTVASFVFLAMVLAIVLFAPSEHRGGQPTARRAKPAAASQLRPPSTSVRGGRA